MDAAEIIAQAREADPAFDARRHPNRVALNFLSRLQRRLVAEWAKLEETSNVEVFTAVFPLADFSAGVALEDSESVPEPLAITALQRPLDMYLRGVEKPVDMDLVRWGDRNRKIHERAAYIVENTLFFTGLETDYQDVERVELTYTPTPADIAAPSELLVLPITAEDALVAHLAAFFARRMNDKELARPRREYIAESLDAEATWLDELRRREGATMSSVKEVW